MPVTRAPTSALNFKPSSTGSESPESAVAGVAKSKIVGSGTTAADGADGRLVPAELVAVTRNVYAVAFVSPVSVADAADAETLTGVCGAPPMYGVTVWPVIALPPSAADGVQLTRTALVAGRP